MKINSSKSHIFQLATMSLLLPSFFQQVEKLEGLPEKFRWYTVLIVTLSAMNYPDEIPGVWKHLSSHYLPLIPQEERLLAARKIREALTKSVGIVGAAKVVQLSSAQFFVQC